MVIQQLLITYTGGVTTPFSPLTLADQLWYDASSEAYSNNAAVTTINDRKTGGGRNATGGVDPVFKTNILNGNPIIRFLIADSSYKLFSDVTPQSIMVLAKVITSEGVMLGGGSGNKQFRQLGDATMFTYNGDDATGIVSSTPAIGYGKWAAFQDVKNGAYIKQLQNGIVYGNAALTTPSFGALNSYNGAGSGLGDIDFAEVILASTPFTVEQQKQVIRYWVNKWKYGNNGTLNNGASFSADVPSVLSANIYSVSFDATNDSITLGYSLVLPATGGISFWTKRNSSSNLALIDYSGNANPNIKAYDYNNSLSFVLVSDTGGTSASFLHSGMGSDNIGVWYHHVITRDGSGNIRSYVNNVESSSGATTGYNGTVTLDRIGNAADCKIADIRVFNTIPTAIDRANMLAGKEPDTESFLHLKLSDGTGTIATDYIISDEVTSPVLPLDSYPSMFKAAYSLRKLKTGNTYAVKIRRSSDNAEQDIGFTSSGDFDIAAFQTFIGGGSGYVTTMYDLSGNGYDLTQTTNSQQPQLVLNQFNGKPSLGTNGTSYQWLYRTQFLSGDSAATAFGVVKIVNDPTTNDGNQGHWLDANGNGSGSHYPYSDGTIYDGFATTSRKTTGNPSFNLTVPHIYTVVSGSGDWRSYINDSLQYSTGSNTFGTQTYFAIGGQKNQENYGTEAKIAEILIANSVVSADDIIAVRRNQNKYYGVY